MSNQGNQTALDASEVRSAGANIRDIAADVNGFSELNDVHPKAGDFAVGTWLNELIIARRDTLHQHCADLQQTLEKVSDQLRSMATEIEEVDRNNGDQVNKVDAELQSAAGEMNRTISTAMPAHPVTPAQQATPEHPVTPTHPVTPAQQATPEHPVTPTHPVTPAQQATPEHPVTPTHPVTPAQQATPEHPVTPTQQASRDTIE